MKYFPKKFYSFYFLFPMFFAVSTHNKTSPVGFPEPPKSENFLFYLQRTVNSNTVIYELNRKSDGEINPEEPIKIQWIRYATDSTYEPLSYIQRNFAYGIDARLIDEGKKSFVFYFVSYKEKPLYLFKSPHDNKYHVYTYIRNQLSVLDKVFVQIEGGTFWVPGIKYVEITGTSPSTAEKLSEKIHP